MSKLLFWLTGRLPCRIISDDGLPYLERYYLFTLLNIRFYIHRFVGSDPDRGLHSHPWAWAISLVLKGWYLEQTTSGTRIINWLNFLTGDTFHRVVIPFREYTDNRGVDRPAQKEVWTLFAHKVGRVKSWHFMRRLEGLDGGFALIPWNYPDDGSASHGKWWETAPLGKKSNREPQ